MPLLYREPRYNPQRKRARRGFAFALGAALLSGLLLFFLFRAFL